MIVIFSGSTDVLSSGHTSRFIGPFLRWFKPDIPDQVIEQIQHAIRKAGHLTEYAILCFLLWRACRKPVKDDPRPWNWKHAIIAWSLATAYSATDEIHQAFVPSRQAQVGDVLIDMMGAGLGLLAVALWGRWRGRW